MEEEARPFEERLEQVGAWVDEFSKTGVVEKLNERLLKSVFVDLGANREISQEEIGVLANYTNKGRRAGMDAVWGAGRYEEYRDWALGWVQDYENSGGRLPRLERSGSKISGMLQFFGELTAWAYGAMTFEDLKRYLEARHLNGKAYQEGRRDERIRITVPTSTLPKRLSSFPPKFPKSAWEKIKTWRG